MTSRRPSSWRPASSPSSGRATVLKSSSAMARVSARTSSSGRRAWPAARISTRPAATTRPLPRASAGTTRHLQFRSLALDLSPETQAVMAEHRRRYDALKAAGTGGAGLALPPATLSDAAAIAPEAVLTDETIPGGWYTALRMRRGEGLRLIDVEGSGSAAFFAWSAADPSERLNHADTIKVQWTAKLAKGRILFSDMGRALVSIVEDTTGGGHDALSGVSNAAS